MRERTRISLRVWLTIVTGLVCAPAWAAESAEVSSAGVEATSFRPGYWTPLRVVCRNPGESAGTLRVDVHTHAPNSGKTKFTGTWALPPHSQRLATMYVLPGLPVREDVGPHGNPDFRNTWGTLDAVAGGRPAGHIPLFGLPADLAMLGAMSSTADPPESERDSSLIPLEVVGSKQYGAQHFKALTLIPFTTPDRSAGWQMLECVAMTSCDFAEYMPHQLEALREWVACGGRLIVFATGRGIVMRDSPLSELLPVTVLGIRRERRLSLSDGLGARWEIELDRYVPVAEVEQTAGRCLYWHDGMPVVVVRQWGLGRVAYCAFPAATLIGVDERTPSRMVGGYARQSHSLLIADLFPGTRGDRPFRPMRDSRLRETGASHLGNLVGVTIPARGRIAALAAAYLCVVGCVFAIMRRRGAAERAWLVGAPLAIVLAAGIVAVARASHREIGKAAAQIDLHVGAAGGAMLHQTILVGLYDSQGAGADPDRLAPRRADLVAAPFEPWGRQAAVLRTRTVRARDRLVRDPLPLQQADLDVTAMGRVRPNDGVVTASLKFGPEGLAGTIANLLAVPIEDAILIYNGRVFAVGDLGPGQSGRVVCNDSTERPKGRLTTADVLDSESSFHQKFIADLLTPLPATGIEGHGRSTGTLLFVGWTRDFDGEAYDLRHSYETTGRSVYVLTLPILPSTPGDAVLSPSAFNTRGHRRADWAAGVAARMPLAQGRAPVKRATSIMTIETFQAPPGIVVLDGAEGEVKLSVEAPNAAVRLYVMPREEVVATSRRPPPDQAGIPQHLVSEELWDEAELVVVRRLYAMATGETPTPAALAGAVRVMREYASDSGAAGVGVRLREAMREGMPRKIFERQTMDGSVTVPLPEGDWVQPDGSVRLLLSVQKPRAAEIGTRGRIWRIKRFDLVLRGTVRLLDRHPGGDDGRAR